MRIVIEVFVINDFFEWIKKNGHIIESWQWNHILVHTHYFLEHTQDIQYLSKKLNIKNLSNLNSIATLLKSTRVTYRKIWTKCFQIIVLVIFQAWNWLLLLYDISLLKNHSKVIERTNELWEWLIILSHYLTCLEVKGSWEH